MSQPAAADVVDPASFKPGLYRHYKGDMYVALFLCRHHETQELFVAYVSMTNGTTYLREWYNPGASSWTDLVYSHRANKMVPRFMYTATVCAYVRYSSANS